MRMRKEKTLESKPLWEWSELCEALGLAHSSGPDIFGLDFDSRKVTAGDLFIALAGGSNQKHSGLGPTARDGHDFVNAAVKKGASGVLVHRQEVLGESPQLTVQNTFNAMQQLGSHRRDSFSGQVIAVTGSSGKTTLKSFLQATIETIGSVVASEGSFNNHIGVPLTLARLPRSHDYAVIEIGTNHFGEIAPLSRLAKPDIAVVLNVQPAHIGNFSGLESLREEKLSIAAGLKPEGILILPDTSEFDDHSSETRCVRFGYSDKADIQIAYAEEDVIEFCAGPAINKAIRMSVPGGGKHRAETLAAAAAILYALDLPLEILLNLDDRSVPVGRGNLIRVAGVSIIDDSYNANPASMVGSLRAFQKISSPARKFAVLGDMAELGADSAFYHRELSKEVEDLDGVCCVGANMRHLYEMLPKGKKIGCFGDADEAVIEILEGSVRQGDQILVKGSNSVFWKKGFVDNLVSIFEKRQ